ncbi:MAG: multidrug effflux MFS transporter [Gemmatimonadaceae bacterium]|nr:multidrug effflux MFS transporter [Chitinophagaceae bacterium]
MKPLEFIGLSACTMALTALGIDIMLPAFGELRTHFGLSADSAAPAQIISFFFMGQVAQIVFGVLSDRYGRIPILRVGFPLYIVGGLAAAFAPNITILLAARFVAGMGSSALLTTTFAGVRDRFVGDEMAKTMSMIFTIFLFTPVVAPFLGMAILKVASWQMVFLTPPLFSVFVFLWSLRLKESLPVDQRVKISWVNIVRSVKKVVSNKTFVRYAVISTMLFAALSSYVASSEYIVGNIYGKPDWFPWIFAGVGLLMSVCSFINSRFSSKFGARRSIKALLIAYGMISLVLFVFTILSPNPPQMLTFFIAVAFLMSINIAVEPNSSALALEPMGDIAGMASSVYGTLFFFIGAWMGSVISELTTRGVLPLVISFFILGLLAVILVFSERRTVAAAAS